MVVQVHARGDFRQHQALLCQAEDGPFRNDQDVLVMAGRIRTGKSDLFDVRLELLVLSFPIDDELPIFAVSS